MTILLLLVGMVNFIPVVGLFGAERLAVLYGQSFTESSLLILMRHRALLFGIVGGFVWASIFVPGWQLPAMLLAGVSMLGFVLIAWQVGDYNAELQRVIVVDLIAILLLAAAAVCWWLQGRSP